MADKYFYKSSDIVNLCEPKVHDAAEGFAVSGGKYNGEQLFQKVGTNCTKVSIPNYMVNGTAVNIVKRGYYPQITANFANKFWSTGTAGTYTITRTDSTLTVGSSTFYPSDFRSGVIPSQVALFLVAGGSGGGGNSYYQRDKDDYPLVSGSGGAGGGMVLAWIDLTVSGNKTITVGAGGAAGSNGSSGSISRGTSGTQGGESNYKVGSSRVVYAYGGVPGSSPSVGEGSYSFAGSPVGGDAGADVVDNVGYIASYSKSGSSGCTPIYDASHEYFPNNSNNKISAWNKALISGAGAPEVCICTEKYWGGTCSTDKIGSNTWFSGGNSYSAGAHYDGVGWYEYTTTAGGGGGGSGNYLRTAGANGLAILCY